MKAGLGGAFTEFQQKSALLAGNMAAMTLRLYLCATYTHHSGTKYQMADNAVGKHVC
jgi:uncharacterized protein YukE